MYARHNCSITCQRKCYRDIQKYHLIEQTTEYVTVENSNEMELQENKVIVNQTLPSNNSW